MIPTSLVSFSLNPQRSAFCENNSSSYDGKINLKTDTNIRFIMSVVTLPCGNMSKTNDDADSDDFLWGCKDLYERQVVVVSLDDLVEVV